MLGWWPAWSSPGPQAGADLVKLTAGTDGWSSRRPTPRSRSACRRPGSRLPSPAKPSSRRQTPDHPRVDRPAHPEHRAGRRPHRRPGLEVQDLRPPAHRLPPSTAFDGDPDFTINAGDLHRLVAQISSPPPGKLPTHQRRLGRAAGQPPVATDGHRCPGQGHPQGHQRRDPLRDRADQGPEPAAAAVRRRRAERGGQGRGQPDPVQDRRRRSWSRTWSRATSALRRRHPQGRRQESDPGDRPVHLGGASGGLLDQRRIQGVRMAFDAEG